MHIITVIPIGRGMGKDTLTYFTRENIAKGSIVSIPIRSSKGYGLVIDSRSAAQDKTEIKALAFSMKKIDHVESQTFLSDLFIKSVAKIADYYATTVGAVLSVLLPKVILDANSELPYTPGPLPVGVAREILVLQADDIERYSTYKSLIREEFAKGRSVFFCLPTTEDIQNAIQTLEKGIETYTHAFHAGLPKKELIKRWQKIQSEAHPVLIVSTGTFLSLPRDDIGTIIVEKESSRAYSTHVRPYLDFRTVAKIVARTEGRRLIFGDSLLRVETVWEEKTGIIANLSPLKFRSLTSATCDLVNMREPQDFKKKQFSIFSDQLKEIQNQAHERSERVFLFCGRKGLYPTTVCSDCGTVVACARCESPVVLYKKSAGNTFVCHHCGEERPADTKCVYCGGWRLTTLGIGVDRVAEEMSEMFPDKKIIIMDKDHLSTHLQAVRARDTFYTTVGAIMIGTEMALPYLNQKIENTAVVSLDSLFAIPDFRIHEKIFHILLDLRALSVRNMIIQTRQKNTTIFDYALKGNLIDFYRDEIEERKQGDFPPFVTFIKLSVAGEKKTIKEKMVAIAESLTPHHVVIFESFDKNKTPVIHGIITLPRGSWIDETLLQKLRELPPAVSIKIDPDTLL